MRYKLSGKIVFLVSVFTLLNTFIPKSVFCKNPDSFCISVKPKDIWPPSRVTNLIVSATNVEGQFELSWTAPTENEGLITGNSVQGYYIRFATFPVNALTLDTTYWWNNATQITVNYANEPHQKEIFITPAIFYPHTTYYFAIKSYDDAEPPLLSQIDLKSLDPLTQAKAVVSDFPPEKVRNLTSTFSYVNSKLHVYLNWNDLTLQEKKLNFKHYCIYRDTVPTEGPWSEYKLIGTATSNSYFDVVDITPNKVGKIYYRVTAQDHPPGSLESVPSEAVEIVWDREAPSVPKGFEAIGSDNKVMLRWAENNETDLLGYNIYRSTNPDMSFYIKINNIEISSSSYLDNAVSNGTTYYYTITAVDIYHNESEHSKVIAVMPRDNIAPAQVLGLRRVLSNDKNIFIIKWSKVLLNEDGSSCLDIEGYYIYKGKNIYENFELKAFVSYNEPLIWQDTDYMEGEDSYYYVLAVDKSKNLSKVSIILNSSIGKGLVIKDPNDSSTYIRVSGKDADKFYQEYNEYNCDLMLEIVTNTYEQNEKVLKSKTFTIKKSISGEVINNFVFSDYAEIVFNYGQLNSAMNRSISISDPAQELALFWFNGLEYIKLNGEVDKFYRSISIKTKRLGKYILKKSLRSRKFSILAIQPDKTFTPNGDGWNDYIEFKYDNPNNAFVQGKIYDINGRVVADMKNGLTKDSLLWDGKDFNGEIVKSGVYLYQIQVSGAEDLVFNGSCIVAK